MVQQAVEVSPEAISEFFADALAIAGTLGRAVASGSRSSQPPRGAWIPMGGRVFQRKRGYDIL
eukprot:COSAG01_NODE_8599_length_2723_cov_3.327363_3_plen_63_part_00